MRWMPPTRIHDTWSAVLVIMTSPCVDSISQNADTGCLSASERVPPTGEGRHWHLLLNLFFCFRISLSLLLCFRCEVGPGFENLGIKIPVAPIEPTEWQEAKAAKQFIPSGVSSRRQGAKCGTELAE